MHMHTRHCALAVGCLATLAACAPRDVGFSADVRPILDKYCLECHVPGGPGFDASGFDMSSYESLMKGGRYGAFVVPGDPLSSNLIILVEGRAHPSIRMPHGREQLDKQEIETLKAWVQEGARNN
jgi:hypothetical protein